MSDLHLDSVSVEYGDATALEDVSLDVDDGEFFTLVGPSGCGKTTTLRTIAGFEEPSSGVVRFGDESMAGVPPEDRDVGVVFQNYALFPHMSVAENVGYGLRFTDHSNHDARVAELLDLVDLAGMEDRAPDELSGGQQQRVSLARALAPEPDVLLLDEPMSALDARLRETLRREVARIQSELGVTTVYVTHDQEEALAVSDRVAVMHDGQVEQVGTPQQVYRAPESRFVAEFVGENNVFSGATSPVETKGVRVRVGEGEFVLGEAVQGDSVTFCVRPEHLRRDHPENQFTVQVTQTEFLGESVRVYCDWDGRQVVWRTDSVPEDETVTLGFDPADATVV
ncbi:ABC transporter ATP-binding protein [Haloarchaeobius sp. DYHT-AS-18]|uniref:ABC transporter ATP-binding protein n=1 Tax=Haloarchaeobius sp. DYHT-AS-18 TaxID=3446117 RepID=UPI003EBEE6F0